MKFQSIAAASLAVATLGAVRANAQQVAVYGGAEAAGLGEGSALLGASISSGRVGWSPVGSLAAYTFTYRSGPGSHTTASAIEPALGLKYSTTTGAVQGEIGYVFVSNGDTPISVIGSPVGTERSTTVSGQASYWGDGSSSTEALASYNLKNQYIWSRFGELVRLGGPGSAYMAGGDVTYQGTSKGTSDYKWQIGPALQYRVTPAFRVTGGAGYRSNTHNSVGSGYARIEFLWLSTPFGHVSR